MNQDNMMYQEMNDDEITIDLYELFKTLWSKAHIILLAGILAALVAFVGTKTLLVPKYTSTTKVYVLKRQEGNSSVSYSELQAGTQLLKDYMELVTSRPVLEQAIEELDLDMEPENLASMVSTESKDDTRIFSILVESEDPEEAKAIADAVREAVCVQITKIMDADAVNTVEEANLPKYPSSPNMKKNVLIGGMLGIFLAVGIIFLIFILDDTIKTPDDVEHYLGLNVLTAIPIQEGVKKPKKVKGLSSKQAKRNMKR